MSAPERVLGLDVSSKCIGWAVMDDGDLVQYGKFLIPGKDHGEKLFAVLDWLTALFQEYQPHQLLFEKPYFGRRRNTYGVLSMYIGAVLAAWFGHSGTEVPTENRVAAHEVKRRLNQGKGASHAARKQAMVKTVNKQFRLRLRYKERDGGKISDDDTADAIAVVWSWATVERPDWGLTPPVKRRRRKAAE